jgi:glycosyltransferase involved in cell wall biosynthesis
MKTKEKRKLCLAYAAGPGDIVNTFSFWQKGQDDPHQIAVTYSSLFFDVCRNLDARGVAISSCPRKDLTENDQFHIENLPKKTSSNRFARHLQQIMYVREVIRKAIEENADLLIMADSTGYFFPFSWFATQNLQLVPTLHCTLWAKSRENSAMQRMVNRLNRNIFRKRSKAVLCLSEDIHRQIRFITGNKTRPVYHFIPHYRKGLFDALQSPPSRRPFNLLYAGRLETDKGIFDLLQIAESLAMMGNRDIIFHLCGNGTEENALRNAAEEKKLTSCFLIHGYCRQDQMLHHIGESHAFIVPTRTTFMEGFNKVVAEAMLAGRPVITSTVCPALEYVREGVVEVPPDDVNGYLEAVIRLSSDSAFYHEKRMGCRLVQEQFYDKSRSWGSALLNIIMEQAHG